MSVEEMTMVTILGPEIMVNTAIRNLVVNREFHLENAIKTLAGTNKLLSFDSTNPYSDLLSKTCSIFSSLGIQQDYHNFQEDEFDLELVSEYLETISTEVGDVLAEREENVKIKQKNAFVIEQLRYFESVDVAISSLFSMKYLKFRYGRLPSDMYKECMQRIDARPDVFYILSGTTERWVYGAYLALPEECGRVDSIFASVGFERIHIDVEGDTESTAREKAERLNAEGLAAVERIKALEAELESIRNSEGDSLMEAYSWLRLMSDSTELRSYVGRRHERFYIIGWVPTAISEAYAAECETYEGFACFLTEPKESKTLSPPVKLKKGFFSGIYEPFVEMYGLPAYNEMDPRLFMAITYTLLFGIMFGDVGQGLSLIVIGMLLWKLKNMWLGRIVALCGVSAAAFGFVYGSVFGNEHLLPGFKVLEDGNTMKILIIAVALGVALILICMIINIINGIRQRDIKKIFFSPNGLSGFVLYAGIAFGVVMQVVRKISVFSPLYIIGVVVLPLFLIFAATPITKLLTGQKDWKPKSVGMFIVEGFFELFETLLSYVSNTVSFLRVGAFAISHAGMMMVVFLLSASADGGNNIVGLIFGNLLVTGLETVLVCIQVMRLEFYEMFGRFYESGGVKFSPKTINYKAAE
ncbi:MAG: V-type ATPase 116kDa subunit family protein [Oscillospiraceae bacterium]